MAQRFFKLHKPSLASAAQFVRDTPRKWRSNASADDHGGRSWDLGADFTETMRLCINGWTDGAKAVATGLETLPARQSAPVRQYRVSGTRPHPVRFATGNPACMIRKGSHERPKPALTIIVQIGANANTNAAHMSNYGLALAAYVEKLALMGYPVELIATCVHGWSDTRAVTSWTVKPLGAPLNYADIAFSIGHPAALRRLVFAMAERSDYPDCGSYGSARDALASDFPECRNAIILNGMKTARDHSETPQGAMEHVSKAIKDAMEAQNL